MVITTVIVLTMDHYCLLLIKRINTTTIYHAHGLTITITKQCGGTLLSFASVYLFNLEHKQESLEITLFRFTFRNCHIDQIESLILLASRTIFKPFWSRHVNFYC